MRCIVQKARVHTNAKPPPKPYEYWRNQANCRELLQHIARSKSPDTPLPDCLYSITTQDIKKHGGVGLLKQAKYSVYNAVSTAFPEYTFLPWKFDRTPRNFWGKQENDRMFLDSVKEQLNIKSLEDFYYVKKSEIRSLGGGGLLYYHGDSLQAVLKSAYPEHNWVPWKFAVAPSGTWQKEPSTSSNLGQGIEKSSPIKDALEEIANQLNLTKLEDWYNVSTSQLRELGVSYAVSRYGSLGDLLASLYPNHEWDLRRFSSTHRKKVVQRRVDNRVQQLLPNAAILHDAAIHIPHQPSSG